MKKIVGSTLDFSTKVFFSLDKWQFKDMDQNSVLLHIFSIKIIEKVLLKCPPPHHHRDQTNHFAYTCTLTFHTS